MVILPSECLGNYIEEPIEITAALGGSRYTNDKIARDHERFKSILAKHYHTIDSSGKKRSPKFKWAKIFTPKRVAHHFVHGNKKAAKIVIKRRHIGLPGEKPKYMIHVKIPHVINGKIQYTAKGNVKHIYNRKFHTHEDPSKHLDRMLGEARWAQHNGKQWRSNRKLIKSSVVQAKKLTTEERNALPDSDFVFPDKRKFPIADRNHAANALSRASAIGGKIKEKVFKAVKERYPDLEHKD
jgi:hypothetical protein